MRETWIVKQGIEGLPGAPEPVPVLGTDAPVVWHAGGDCRRVELRG